MKGGHVLKIGIITLHGENNYGAALQTVALKIALDKFGITKIINYSSNVGTTPMNSVLIKQNETKNRILSNMIFNLFAQGNRVPKAIEPLERIYKFKQFINTYGNLTNPYSYAQLANNEIESFNVYVSGSDQIWNPKLTNMDPVFFSDYASSKAKKVSYASSTGGYRFTANEANIIKKHLSSFNYISTREEDTAKMLEDITGRGIAYVLDPVFLLNREEWIKKFHIKKRNTPYVLVYNMNMNPRIFEIAHSVAKTMDAKIYNIRNWYCISQPIEDKRYLDEFFINAGPIDFLELFYNASFVVTDSFHGTAFSINFNKPFVSIPPESGPSRITNILKLVGLSDRLISNLEELKKIDLDIDYSPVNVLLEEQRDKSIKFLRNALAETGSTEEN